MSETPTPQGQVSEETGQVLRALRFRLSQRIAWFHSPSANVKPWWVTDFTHDQIEGNLKQCVEMIDRALDDALISSPAQTATATVREQKTSSASVVAREAAEEVWNFFPLIDNCTLERFVRHASPIIESAIIRANRKENDSTGILGAGKVIL